MSPKNEGMNETFNERYIRTHLVLAGTGWPQELPVEHTVVAINVKNTWEK